MKLNLYVIQDIISGDFQGTFSGMTDAAIVRAFKPNFDQGGRRLADYKLYRVGTLDVETGDVRGEPKKLVEWSSYVFESESVPLEKK